LGSLRLPWLLVPATCNNSSRCDICRNPLFDEVLCVGGD
jgi:hypothetical protein